MTTPKIKYVHYRERDIHGRLESRGGATVAFIEKADGIDYAVARCSYHDNFNKAYGRAKAAGRLASPRHRQISPTAAVEEFYQIMQDRYNTGMIGCPY
jgi:hypothetical protein